MFLKTEQPEKLFIESYLICMSEMLGFLLEVHNQPFLVWIYLQSCVCDSATPLYWIGENYEFSLFALENSTNSLRAIWNQFRSVSIRMCHSSLMSRDSPVSRQPISERGKVILANLPTSLHGFRPLFDWVRISWAITTRLRGSKRIENHDEQAIFQLFFNHNPNRLHKVSPRDWKTLTFLSRDSTAVTIGSHGKTWNSF
jgi:hypothetical protein